MSWPEHARLALSLVINVEEGSELSLRDGDRGPDPVDELGIAIARPIRNYGNESNYLYGIRAGAPRVMQALTERGLSATFTAAALSLERAPQLCAAIVEGGHEVCSHGWRWIHQFRMDEAEERTFIRKAVQSIERSVGERPVGWLSRYLTTENTVRLLVEEGFEYHMDDYSDDRPFWQHVGDRRIVVVPYALDNNDMKLWTAPALTPADWLQYAVDSFDRLYREGAHALRMMSLGVHLRIIGRPGRIDYFERFLDHVLAHDGVWIATRAQIARHWRAQHDLDD
ncbi:MAG: polysaccharide deacetylase family protein [Gammaproteobacteria bacterium]|nr:polysaccharide deacetylase family protein [Gammaproteobacteria bacterium]